MAEVPSRLGLLHRLEELRNCNAAENRDEIDEVVDQLITFDMSLQSVRISMCRPRSERDPVKKAGAD